MDAHSSELPWKGPQNMSSEAIALWTETSSDPELIAGVRAGDSAAFGVLYERHAAAARKVAAQYTNAASDVDDVVSEAFARVLRALQRGDGPDLAFRAYLFTIVRRTGMDIIDKGIRTKPRDDMSPYESTIGYGASSDEPTLEGFEHGMVAHAYTSLPERWQAVLWYTEVEKKSPREIAPLLGLSANGVAALAYRAREALRQAYLQQHLGTSEDTACLEANTQLGAFVRGGLSNREQARVNAHVSVCERCTALVTELEDVNRGMRGIIAPLFMGVLGAGALEGGLPIGGALGSQAAGTVGTTGAGGAGAAGAGATTTGATAGASGLAGLLGVASQLALPVAAAVGVTALALSGASILGWLSPGDDFDEPGSPVLAAESPTPTPDSSGGTTPSPEASPSTVPSPSASPDAADDPPVSEAPTTPPGADAPLRGDGSVPGDQDSGASGASPGDGDGNPYTGGVGPGTGGEEPGTGGEEPGTGGEEPGTGGEEPGTGGEEPGTGGEEPGTGGAPRLSIGKSPLDYLEISRTSPSVSLTVANDGDGAAQTVSAQISLPDGLQVAAPAGGAGFALATHERVSAFVDYAATSTLSVDGWECTVAADAAQATCSLDSIEPGATASLSLEVMIAAEELDEDSFTVFDVRAGDHRETYSVRTALSPHSDDSNPLDPGYADGGGLAVAQFGGTVMGCDAAPLQMPAQSACRTVMDTFSPQSIARQTNNDWNMVQLNENGGTTNSGTTTITLPPNATVKAAFLEWSANRYVHPTDAQPSDTWTGPLDSARVRLDSGQFVDVTADTVDDGIVEENRQYYLSRADVTDLVASASGQTLTVADIAVSETTRERNVKTYYGGFTVTIVYEDPAQPETSEVALFEGPHWVKSSSPVAIRFHADEGALVTPSWTAFEGDRGNKGDSMRLGGDDFQPLGPDGNGAVGPRDSGDIADSTAFGSPWGNTLGVDAKPFSTKVITRGGIHTLTTSTSGDNFMIGTLAITLVPRGGDSAP
ncbi:sigma-70 family RNA polymerase sigma factor [Demequina sp. SO4-18]|uniref:sigma-70 family RNA polymerase sigma factor n=1 Tax=Demequina sp. SO4-18 TaxID=3401026 RepID=UPI003B597716